MNPITPKQAVVVLNRALKADPETMKFLVENRATCNRQLANDPTIQVGLIQEDRWEVGMLGIINGIFGVDAYGWGYVAAVYDGEELVKFMVVKRADDPRIHVCEPGS